MEFGLNFFPDVGPDQKSGEQYYRESLGLVSLCDELNLTHVRIVEHYFNAYGGYSPNPIVFLAAGRLVVEAQENLQPDGVVGGSLGKLDV